MGLFEKRFYNRENKIRHNYSINDSLYKWLQQNSLAYDATISDLFNVCVDHLIESENIVIYESPADDFFTTRTIPVRESNVAGLENLKTKYGVSISKLANIAIKNVLDEYEAEKRMG